MDTQEFMDARQALHQELKSQGISIEIELLYSKSDGSKMGHRVGLKDHDGDFFADYFFDPLGIEGDLGKALRTCIDRNGHAPRLWATQASL